LTEVDALACCEVQEKSAGKPRLQFVDKPADRHQLCFSRSGLRIPMSPRVSLCSPGVTLSGERQAACPVFLARASLGRDDEGKEVAFVSRQRPRKAAASVCFWKSRWCLRG